MKYHWAEWGFEPTPATTAAPSPSESGVITTAPLRLLKTSFMEQYYAWFLWMTRRIGYIFGALAHSLYTRNSLDPKDTEAWKYYYNLRFKQTSTKNSSPGSILMQVLQKKMYREKPHSAQWYFIFLPIHFFLKYLHQYWSWAGILCWSLFKS